IAWRFEPPRRAKAFYASVAATEHLIIAGSRDKNVYGLDRGSGKQEWSFATGGNVDGSPVVVGGRVYVGSLDGTLYVLNLENGSEVQRVDLGAGISASPSVVDDHLVIGTQDGVLYCLGKKGG